MPKKTPITAQAKLNKMIRQRPGGKRNTWRSLAAQLSAKAPRPISAALLFQVANGERRAPNNLLIALRLPLNPVPAQPCPKCGEVHVKKTCTHKRHAKRSGALRWTALIDLHPQQIVALFKGRKEYKP